MSNTWNGLFKTKFKGCEQIGYKVSDDGRVHLRVFKVPNADDLVGIYDGIDCWVANPKYCLLHMKPGIRPGTATRRTVLAVPITDSQPKPRRVLLNAA